jgi:hypothetical protein
MEILQDGGLWIARVPTVYGHMELLCGEGDRPDIRALMLVEHFLGDGVDHIAAVRGSALSMAFLWRPIRFAINNEGRLGLQFKHRLTGGQAGMFFADEHSSFTRRLSDIAATEEDESRLRTDGGS